MNVIVIFQETYRNSLFRLVNICIKIIFVQIELNEIFIYIISLVCRVLVRCRIIYILENNFRAFSAHENTAKEHQT